MVVYDEMRASSVGSEGAAWNEASGGTSRGTTSLVADDQFNTFQSKAFQTLLLFVKWGEKWLKIFADIKTNLCQPNALQVGELLPLSGHNTQVYLENVTRQFHKDLKSMNSKDCEILQSAMTMLLNAWQRETLERLKLVQAIHYNFTQPSRSLLVDRGLRLLNERLKLLESKRLCLQKSRDKLMSVEREFKECAESTNQKKRDESMSKWQRKWLEKKNAFTKDFAAFQPLLKSVSHRLSMFLLTMQPRNLDNQVLYHQQCLNAWNDVVIGIASLQWSMLK